MSKTKTVVFEALVNQEVKFYGVDNNCFKLGATVYEAVEDPDDGYRSYLESVEITDPKDKVFFKRPLATVKVVEVTEEEIPGHYDGDKYISTTYGFRGYALVDVVDGHTWLRFGTDDYEDYYPGFAFNYYPKGVSVPDIV